MPYFVQSHMGQCLTKKPSVSHVSMTHRQNVVAWMVDDGVLNIHLMTQVKPAPALSIEALAKENLAVMFSNSQRRLLRIPEVISSAVTFRSAIAKILQ